MFSDGTKLTQSSAAANFFWDETNNRLGIGTTTPDGPLSIRAADPMVLIKDTDLGVSTGNARIRFAESGVGGSTDNFWDIGTNISGAASPNYDLGFNVNGTNVFTILRSGGNVGLGTTSPGNIFEVYGDAKFLSVYDSDTVLADDESAGGIKFSQSDASGVGEGARIEAVGNGTTGLVDLQFSTGGNGTVSPRTTITSTGSVGIGNTSPSTLLHVGNAASDSSLFGASNISASTDLYSTNAQIRLEGTVNTGYNGTAGTSTAKIFIGGYDNDGNTVYPIYTADENAQVDFFLRESCYTVGSAIGVFWWDSWYWKLNPMGDAVGHEHGLRPIVHSRRLRLAGCFTIHY